MKGILLFAVFTVLIKCSFGQISQDTTKGSDSIYTKVTTEATIAGGDVAWRTLLMKSLNPNALISKGAKPGRYNVTLRFVVHKDGTINTFECIKDPGYGACEECIRVTQKASAWTPATYNGTFVDAYKTQDFTFVIQ